MCLVMENSVSLMVLDVELIKDGNVISCMLPEDGSMFLSIVRLLSESDVVIKITGHHLHYFD